MRQSRIDSIRANTSRTPEQDVALVKLLLTEVESLRGLLAAAKPFLVHNGLLAQIGMQDIKADPEFAAILVGLPELDAAIQEARRIAAEGDRLSPEAEAARTARIEAFLDASAEMGDLTDTHPAHTECADGCGLAVTHQDECRDKPGGRVVCEHDDVCRHCGVPIHEDDNGAGGTVFVHEFGSTVCFDDPAGSVTEGDTTTTAEPAA